METAPICAACARDGRSCGCSAEAKQAAYAASRVRWKAELAKHEKGTRAADACSRSDG